MFARLDDGLFVHVISCCWSGFLVRKIFIQVTNRQTMFLPVDLRCGNLKILRAQETAFVLPVSGKGRATKDDA